MSLKRNPHIRQRGIAVVELAIVLPLLLLIFLGTAEFGRALYQYNTLTKTVRDGARYISQHSLNGTTGVVDIPPTAVAVVETKNLVVYGIRGGAFIPLLPGFTTGDVTVIDAGANNVTVTASYNFASIFGPILPIQFLGGPISLTFTMQATVTMRALS